MQLPDDSIERILSSFDGLDLGDPRRIERLRSTLQRMAESPGVSIPAAMGSDAELEGAYRFFHNPRVTLDELTEAHAQSTTTRAREVGVVLAIHDTTTCEFARADPKDVGYLSTGRAGFMVHYTLVVAANESRKPLGIINTEVIFRTRPPSRPSKNGRRERNRGGAEIVRDPNRESRRWLRGFETSNTRLGDVSVIHVADREGDFYELLGNAVEQGFRFVIRVRADKRRVKAEDGTRGTIRSIAETSKGVLHREAPLSTRKAAPQPRAQKTHPPRTGRLAMLTFSTAKVELDKPRYLERGPDNVQLNMVRVYEENPPAGESPVEWMLFTTEPVGTADEVAFVVDSYRARWMIEECNKALKTGCRYEEHQFESQHALLNVLALSLPIACELLWLRACCRSEPTKPAREVLTPVQLEILMRLGSYKLPTIPTVHDALWAVAAMGGHIRSNGEPGWLILHRGMAKLLAYEQGWIARDNASRDLTSR